MYWSQILRRYQYFVATEWPGGIYPSPSVAGSRPGCLVAAAWATIMAIGEVGYLQYAKTVHETFRTIYDGLVLI